MSIKKEYKFIKYNNFKFEQDMFNSLSLLYKPIIMDLPYNLYLTLINLSELNQEVSNSDLIDAIALDTLKEKSLNEAFSTLEYAKLYDSKNDIIYPPYTTEFFNLPLINYLKSNSSKSYFNKILKKYNLTDTFEYPVNSDIKSLSDLIDYNSNFKENKKEETKEDKELIEYIKNHNAYEIINNSLAFISLSDKNTIDRIKREFNLKDELLSLLVVYSLVTNNNKLHQFRYYETIILDWKGKNIETLEDAYFYIDSKYKNRPKSKTVKAEDWFSNYWKKEEK